MRKKALLWLLVVSMVLSMFVSVLITAAAVALPSAVFSDGDLDHVYFSGDTLAFNLSGLPVGILPMGIPVGTDLRIGLGIVNTSGTFSDFTLFNTSALTPADPNYVYNGMGDLTGWYLPRTLNTDGTLSSAVSGTIVTTPTPTLGVAAVKIYVFNGSVWQNFMDDDNPTTPDFILLTADDKDAIVGLDGILEMPDGVTSDPIIGLLAQTAEDLRLLDISFTKTITSDVIGTIAFTDLNLLDNSSELAALEDGLIMEQVSIPDAGTVAQYTLGVDVETLTFLNAVGATVCVTSASFDDYKTSDFEAMATDVSGGLVSGLSFDDVTNTVSFAVNHFSGYTLSVLENGSALFFDDFESYSENAYPSSFIQQYNGTGDANQKVIATENFNGSTGRVFQLEGASSWSSEQYRSLPTTLPDDLIVDAYIKPVTNSRNAELSLRNLSVGSWGTRISSIWFEGDGTIVAIRNGDDNDRIVIGTYTIGNWYRVTLDNDMISKTYDIYIDGVLAVADIPMNPTVTPTTLSLIAHNVTTSMAYFDNVGLYNELPDFDTAPDASGNAVGFDSSSNSYITVPDSNSLDVTNALTFEAWIKPNGGGEWSLISGKQLNPSDGNPWYSYRLLAASANSGEKGFPRKVAFQIAPEGSGETGVESDTVIQNNVWTHVAGVYDGTLVKIYINGVLENSNPVTGSIQTSDLPLFIGKAPWTNYNNYNGLIDEVRVWNVARTAEQISYDMQYSLIGSESGLVGYWRFNEASGITTADATGNNNDGALYNGVYFTLSGATVTSPYDGEYNIEDSPVIISADGDYRIFGTGVSTANTIVVNTGVTANIVLDNVNINVSGTSGACAFDIQGTSQVNVTLASGSENTLRSGEYKAGLQVADTAQLTIDADADYAGILDSYSGNYAAGIGGAYQHSGGSIIIENGVIHASASYGSGSGIGSGLYGDGCDITINGGNITATGNESGAGIGSGGGGDVGSIYIHGGTVTASSTGNENYYDGGSGIGSGDDGYNGEILIDGGTITASGKYDCPGIGGCYGSSGTITIRGAGTTVTASSGLYAAAIGGGYGDGGGIINIEGGTVTANGRYRSPGIGDYDDGTTVINISGGTVISNGGADACGIGSGYYSEYNPLPILNFTGGNLSVSHGAGASYDINAQLKTSGGEAFFVGGCLVPSSGQVVSITGPITGIVTYDLNGTAANETIVTAMEESASGYFVLYPLETGMQIIRQDDDLSWKYAADAVQPQLTAGTANRNSDSEADITFTCDEFAEFFYRVTADGAAVPDIDTSGNGDYCEGESTLHLDSLTTGACDIYVQAKDMAGNEGPMIKIDIDAFAEDVCQKGDTKYTSLADALDDVTSGQTIKLLGNITYIERIWAGSSYHPSLTLDLNGYVLNISNVEVPIAAIDGYDITVTDSSESGGGTLILNTTSGDSAPTGVTAVGTGSSVLVDSSVTTIITATGDNSKGVSAYNGGNVEIGSGSITSDTYGIYTYGISGDTVSLVTFTGNVSALLNYGIGVYAENGGIAMVTGDITGPYIGHGVIAYEGLITITGDVASSGFAATARGSGIVTVTGNATATGEFSRGAYAYNGGTVNIGGSVTASGSYEYGVYADNGGCITVGGNVSQTGSNGVGAYAIGFSDGGEITIGGSIDAATYLQVGGETKEPDDKTEPTTKEGYYTYSYGDPVSTVWAKTVYSTDANLSALSATGITLSPAFSSSVTSYSASVVNAINLTMVTAQLTDSKATVSINGSSGASKTISLSEGSNVITVLVTAEDGTTTKTHTITISRAYAGGGGGSSAPVGQQVTVSTPDGKTGVAGTLTESGNKTQVTIGGAQFGKLVDADQGAVIPASSATVTFDPKAVNTINGASTTGDVVLTVEKIDPTTLTPEQQKSVGDQPVYDFTLTKGGQHISSFGGGHAEILIPYTLKPGENPNQVVIYNLADDGSLKTVRGHYNPETKCVIFKTTHFSKYAVGYNPVFFNDVASDAWYKDAVDFIAARGITSGTENGAYSPNAPLTRGQFVVLLMNACGISPDTAPTGVTNFADASNTYYTHYLLAAKSFGIVKGVGNNMFAPEQAITRQEMFVMLYNALKVIGELPLASGTKQLSDFSDAHQVASWAQESLSTLVLGDVIKGSDGNLAPNKTTSRAQMAQVLYNLLSK